MLVTASRSWFVFLQLFFALTESILWPSKPSSASVHPAHLKQSKILSIWWYQTVTQTRCPPETEKEEKNVQFAVSHLGLAPVEQWKHMTG